MLRQQGLLQDSLWHHNTQLEIATGRDRQEELAEAHQHLVQVHSLIAEAAMDSGDHETAMVHLQACSCETPCIRTMLHVSNNLQMYLKVVWAAVVWAAAVLGRAHVPLVYLTDGPDMRCCKYCTAGFHVQLWVMVQ